MWLYKEIYKSAGNHAENEDRNKYADGKTLFFLFFHNSSLS